MRQPASPPRPAAPGPGPATAKPPPQDPDRPTPSQAAAALSAAVLSLWTPFTLILALLLNTQPTCANSTAKICTPLGHLAATWSPTTAGALGLLLVTTGGWLYPRRHHAIFALAALATAALGLLITLALLDTTPTP